ncbi:cytochrome c oxidase assembly factor CtaG [Saliterribacillus persicus]|uniref:Putative membrane protein n=1 Tax=Saliterribacillus persicus TaxID=930114 RepID=A0A368XUW2_9BACI|nr:cytochrome c oxidase assembly factor CtaG [Saliterribacillus persicus]RCW70828.1 putative membrane protein [Saliterribacillus persicus]
MWQELQIFGFRALWSPYFLLFVSLIGILYFFLFIRNKEKYALTNININYFYTGIALLYIIKGSPIDLLSHIMFTAHMVQMALYYLLFPILIIKGIPKIFWQKVFQVPVLSGILKLFTKPLIALILFNALFSMYHVPSIFDFAKGNEIAHASITTVILITAFFVWWPIFTPIKAFDTLSPLLKIGYIFANGVLITPACALIIFADHSLYTTYGQTGGWVQALALCVPGSVLEGLSLNGPEMFSPMSILEDQQLGGILMKVSQEIIYGTILARIFFPWFRKESGKIDPLPASSDPHTTS